MPKLLKWLLRDERPLWLQNRAPEVSTVDLAANLQPFFVKKAKGDMDMPKLEEILKGILEGNLEGEEAIRATLKNQGVADDTSDGLVAAAKALKSVKDLPKNAVEIVAKAAGLSLPDPPKASETPDPIDKALKDVPEAVQKAFRETQAKAEAAEKKALELEEKALVEQYAKAAADLKSIPGIEAEKFGPVLKEIAIKAPDAYKVLLPILTSVDKAIAEGDLFRSKGSDALESGPVEQKIESLAKALMEKDSALTIEKARVRVYEQHPDLYDAI